MEYYVPKTKDELVKFFVIQMGYHATSLRKMAKPRLYAIYHKVMRNKTFDNFTLCS